jgi:hypothetical protein
MFSYNVASSVAGYNSQYITFETHEGAVSAGERMRITSTGNVGIGTTVEAGRLNINSTNSGGDSTALSLMNRGTANNTAVQISFRGLTAGGSENDYGYIKMVQTNTSTPASDLSFWTQSVSVAERMRIFSDGNVFIGSSPSNGGFKLDVNGTGRFNSTSSTPFLINTNTDNTTTIRTSNGGGNSYISFENSGDANNAFAIGRSNAGDFVLNHSASSVYGGGTLTNYLNISSTGAATFSSSVTATQFITGGTPSNTAGFTNSFYAHSNFPSITLSNTSTNTGKFTLGVTEGSFGIWNNTTNSYPFFINSSNNVLIGTTTDNSNKLRVNGTGWFDGNVLMGNSVNRFVGLGTGNSNAHISFTPTNDINFNGQSAALFQFTLNGVQIGRFNNAEVFGQSVRTTAPTGGSAENWKLGNAATGTVNANRLIRVEIAGVGYDLVARQII